MAPRELRVLVVGEELLERLVVRPLLDVVVVRAVLEDGLERTLLVAAEDARHHQLERGELGRHADEHEALEQELLHVLQAVVGVALEPLKLEVGVGADGAGPPRLLPADAVASQVSVLPNCTRRAHDDMTVDEPSRLLGRARGG